MAYISLSLPKSIIIVTLTVIWMHTLVQFCTFGRQNVHTFQESLSLFEYGSLWNHTDPVNRKNIKN